MLPAVNRAKYIRAADTVSAPDEKRARFDRLRNAGAEGVVFKDTDAPYTPGRPNSGGTQLKYKFYKSASCVVLKSNGNRRSVALGLLSSNGDSDDPVGCGNVTIPANHEIPAAGNVVEVRYLYAYPESNALCQPVYLGTREDIPICECLLDQLSYKAA